MINFVCCSEVDLLDHDGALGVGDTKELEQKDSQQDGSVDLDEPPPIELLEIKKTERVRAAIMIEMRALCTIGYHAGNPAFNKLARFDSSLYEGLKQVHVNGISDRALEAKRVCRLLK